MSVASLRAARAAAAPHGATPLALALVRFIRREGALSGRDAILAFASVVLSLDHCVAHTIACETNYTLFIKCLRCH